MCSSNTDQLWTQTYNMLLTDTVREVKPMLGKKPYPYVKSQLLLLQAMEINSTIQRNVI